MWDLRRQHKGQCAGYGFIIDVGKTTVAIPKSWNIPQREDFKGYRVIRDCEFKPQRKSGSVKMSKAIATALDVDLATIS